MIAHNFDLRKIGTEQIYGKPTWKDKISINVKAFRFVLKNEIKYIVQIY